jgi:hypothetical protein
MPPDSVLEGDDEVSADGEAVSEGDAVTACFGSLSVGVAEGGVAVERVADGWSARAGCAASTRDLSSMASNAIKTALTKTNPPMAAFDQLPFRLSGMRRSLTGRIEVRRHDRPAAEIGYCGRSCQRTSRETG